MLLLSSAEFLFYVHLYVFASSRVGPTDVGRLQDPRHRTQIAKTTDPAQGANFPKFMMEMGALRAYTEA